MKRFIDLFFITIVLLFASACNKEVDKEVDVHLYLDDYVVVNTDDNITFEYQNSIGIDTVFEISSIEVLTSDYAITPYESTFITGDDVKIYLDFLSDYLNQISENRIIDSNIRSTGLKAKVTYTLVNETSEIKMLFYQNENGEIVSSEFIYTNGEVEVYYDYTSSTNLQYEELNSILLD